MEKQKAMTVPVPQFANEQEEAAWWASADGRKFLKVQSARRQTKSPGGSRLVTKLAKSPRDR